MSEHTEQVNIIKFCKLQKIPVFSIPNGMWVPGLAGVRLFSYIAKMKAEGMEKGVPDLFFPIVRNGFHGLFIELKTKTGRLSPEQKEWLKTLSENGYRAICCYGATEAIAEIKNYIKES